MRTSFQPPSERPQSFRFLAQLLALLLILSGCDSGGGTGPARLPVEVDTEAVFAPPTPAELATVEAEWAVRSVAAVGVAEHLETRVSVGGTGATVRIVSHIVPGPADTEAVQHYGAIITPDGLAPGSAPVLVYAHGGDAGVSVDEEALQLLGLFPDVADGYVVVVPSFRDEPLSFAGQTWVSDGPASPWDYDVDDALALLSVASQVEPAADAGRTVVLGFSRGAGVGLLMDVRDPRIVGVVDFFGPSDFYGEFVQEVFEEALDGAPRDLPGIDVLNSRFITPLSRGELSLGVMRLELARRSPVLWSSELARLQVHHGTSDSVVPVSQSQRLSSAMSAIGRTSPDFEAFFYTGGGHDPFTLSGSFSRARDFLLSHLAR